MTNGDQTEYREAWDKLQEAEKIIDEVNALIDDPSVEQLLKHSADTASRAKKEMSPDNFE